jgi:integrase/recombinase XerC
MTTNTPKCLSDFATFLENSERSPLTIKNYLSDLSAFSAWFGETNGNVLSPEKITPTDLREYKTWLVNRKQLKPASVNRKLATLKSFITWANELGLAPQITAGKVPKLEREVKRGPRWLDRREQNALLRAVERGGSTRDLAIAQVLICTGVRVEELCSLEWQDITIGERKGLLVVRAGKGRKRREVPLNADARSALQEIGYKAHIGERVSVFQGQRGPLTPRGVQNMLSKYAADRGLVTLGKEGVSPHELRHTFCKNLVDAGVSLEKVAALAGHESLDYTRIYTEPSLLDLEKAVEMTVIGG